MTLVFLFTFAIGNVWGADTYYVVCNRVTLPLTGGMSGAIAQLLKLDGTTLSATTDFSIETTGSEGFYYNSTTATYASFTTTSNYGTGSSSNRTMSGFKLGEGKTLTIKLGKTSYSKLDVIYACGSKDQKSITIAGTDYETTDKNNHKASITSGVTGDIVITNSSDKDYYVFAILTKSTGSSCGATANAGADKATTAEVGVAMAATAAAEGYTGVWSIKAGSQSTDASQLGTTSSNTMTFTPSAAGTYTLVWTVTSNSDNTCSASDEATVTASAPKVYHSITPNIASSNYESYTIYQLFKDKSTVNTDYTEWVSGSLNSAGNTWSTPSGLTRFVNDEEKDWKLNKDNSIEFDVTNCISVAILYKSGSTSRYVSLSVKNDGVEVGTVASGNTNSITQLPYGTTLDATKNYVITVTNNSSDNSYIEAISFEAPATKYTVTLNPNDGSYATTPEGWTVSGSNYTIEVEAGALAIPEPEREGFGFNGWKSGLEDVSLTAGKLTVSKDTTLTAQWGAVVTKYSVSYSLNGATGTAPTETDKAAGAEFNLAAAQEWPGYAFLGWLCNIDSDVKAAETAYTMTAANTTFTAQWKVNAPAIAFNRATGLVTITATEGATIKYSLDGSDPASGTTYTAAFTIDENKTVKAIAIKEGCTNSEVTSKNCALCHEPAEGAIEIARFFVPCDQATNAGWTTSSDVESSTGKNTFGVKGLGSTTDWSVNENTGLIYGKFGSSSYVTITLKNDASFQEGDVVTAYFNDNDAKCNLKLHNSDGNALGDATASDFDGEYVRSKALVAGDIESDGSLKFVRVDSKTLLNRIIVTRIPKYTMSFDANGHGTAPSALENQEVGTKPSKPTPDPSETGYTFGGWWTKADWQATGAAEWNWGTDAITEDITLYAKWTVKSHNLNWVIGDDATITNPDAYTHGTVNYGTAIVAPTLERDGFDFLGWGATVAETMPDNDLEYTAQWAEAVTPYDITFAAGDNTAATVPIVMNASNVTLEAIDSDDNYRFDGWKADVDVKAGSITGETITAGTMIASGALVYVTQATTFTAQWTPKYAVTFNSNGGTAVATQYIVSGGTAEEPTAPTRLNYTFGGWKIGEAAYDFATEITDAITLKAAWTRNTINVDDVEEAYVADVEHAKETPVLPPYEGTAFDLTKGGVSIAKDYSTATNTDDSKSYDYAFLPSGGTGSVDNAYTLTANKAISSLVIYYTMTDSKFVEKDQSKSGGFSYKINDEDAVTGDTGNKSNKTAYKQTISSLAKDDVVKLYSSANRLAIFGIYATYTPDPITVTIKEFAHDGSDSVMAVTSGETLGNLFDGGELPNIVKAGYTFNGWKNAANDADVEASTTITANMTIYADLVGDEYNVALENGENDGAATVHYGDDALTITTPVVGEEDNMLLGYFTAATEGTKVADNFGKLVAGVEGYTDANGKWNKEADVTLYAQWQAIDFCYTFAPSASTGAIAAGDEITTSNGGTMTMVQGAMSYATGNLVAFTYADNIGAVAEIELNHKLQAGSIIKVDMHKGGSSVRGLELQTAEGDNVANLAWNPANADDTVIYYTVGLGNPLIGKSVFRLARYQGNVYLRSLKVGACGNEVFKVTFDLQGHGDAIEAQYLEANALVTAPTEPTTTDLFTFGGWYKEATCTNAWDFANDQVTAATTIFAKWTAIPELEDEYVWKKGTSYTGCVAEPDDDAADPLYTSVTVEGMDKMSSGRPSTANTEVIVTIASAQEGYAIKSICTYGKLEEPAGAQISWDDGTTWEDLAAYSEGQKSFNAPMAKFPTNFKLKFTGVSTSSGGLWWRNALVTLELIKTQDGDPVISLAGAKVNGTAISATDLATLQGSHELDITTSYVDAPVVSFVKRTTINFTDATSVYEDEDVDVTATENTSNKWEASAEINDIDYTVTLAIPTDPILDTETTALTLVSAKNGSDSKSFTFSGRNLSNDVTISLASEVDGLTINPTVVTPDANGKVTEQEVTVTYASLEDVAEAHVVLTVAYSETVKKEITLTYSSTKGYAALVSIEGDKTWNWTNAYNNNANAAFSPKDPAEAVILANVDNMVNSDDFNADALEGIGEYAVRKEGSNYYFQGSMLHFNTLKAGIVYVKFSGTNNKSRVLKVYNNADTEVASWAYNNNTAQELGVYVPAGDVTIKAFESTSAAYARIYQIVFDAEPQPAEAEESTLGGYERDVNPQYYGTICLPKAGVMTGALLFQVAYMDYKEDGVTPYKVYYDQVENGTMAAGMPYIFLAEQSKIGVYYTATAEETAKDHNGLHGTLTDMSDMSATGIYMLYNNQVLHSTNPASNLPANRAYLQIGEIPGYENPNYQAPAPKFRRISTGFNAPQVATGIDELNASEAPVKMIIDGKMYILRGEKLYDVTGKLVK